MMWIVSIVPAAELASRRESDATSKSKRFGSPAAPGTFAPVAIAGPDQAATVGVRLTLDGTGSWHPTGDPLTFAWSLVSVPAESAVTLISLSDPVAARPTFIPDVFGEYIWSLVVNDGSVVSPGDTVIVTATP